MKKLLAGFFFLVVVVVVVVGIGAVLAIAGSAPECPVVKETTATADQIDATLNKDGVVRISNGDATSVGKTYVGEVVDGLRVCFDTNGGHASGKLNAGPVKIPFYASTDGVDLTGSTPKVTNLKVQLGSLPDVVANVARSSITNLINNSLGTIKMKKQYTAEFADGVVTVKTK